MNTNNMQFTKWFLGFVCLFSPAVAQADLSNGLVAHYLFEGNASDATGNGHHGITSDTSYVPGFSGEGSLFSGADDSFVEVQHADEISPTSAVTIAAWVKVNSFPQAYSAIFYKAAETPTNNGFKDRSYTLWSTNALGFQLSSTPEDGSAQVVCNTSGGLFQLNDWVHVTGVVDAANASMRIYVNSILQKACSFTATSIKRGSFPLRIGGVFKTLSDQSALHGVLDDVRIYNRSLTDTEIASLFSNTIILVQSGDLGYYNDKLGTVLNLSNTGVDDANEPFPVHDDSSASYTVPPDLSAASSVLGNWFMDPHLLNSNWSNSPIKIPNGWAVGTEVAVIYQFETINATNVIARFGVDNGIYVWLDGKYIFGARDPGGSTLGEYEINLGDLDTGRHFLQLLLEDHGITNGYVVEISAAEFIPIILKLEYLNNNVVYMGRTGETDSTDELFLINSKTRQKTKLTDNSVADGTPAISPNGKTLIFGSMLDGEWDLYKMDLDSRQSVNLTNTDSINEGWPVISPDGTRFVYKLQEGGNVKLMTMNLEGGDHRTLLDNRYSHAAWSPSGRHLVLSGVSGTGGLDLFNMENESLTLQLTAGYDDDYPVFTNDGQYILFASDRCGNGSDKFGVFLFNLVDETTTEVLCDANTDYRHLSMAKDGRLLFSRGSAKGLDDRHVWVTTNPLDAGDLSALESELQNASQLSSVVKNNHPVAAQYHSSVAEPVDRYVPGTPHPGGADHAVVITHGTASGVRKGWIIDFENQTGIADRICDDLGATIDYLPDEGAYINNFTRHCTNGVWDVIVADWEIDSYTGPIQAWGTANDVGFKVGEYLAGAGYEHVHMMGHSAGSQVIQQASNYISKVVPAEDRPFIHLTFFDPYDPFAMLLCDGQISLYGEGSDWADNYVDIRPLATIPGAVGESLSGDLGGNFDATKGFLPNAYNVDVTKWDPLGINAHALERHAWPYNLYRDYTFLPMIYPLGYQISRESGHPFPHDKRDIGKACILQDNSEGTATLLCESIQTVCDVSDIGPYLFTLDNYGIIFKQVYDSIEGIADLITLPGSVVKSMNDVLGIDLTTGSPAWQEWSLEINELANALVFDYEYLSDAEGLITVYFDGKGVARFDERYAGEGVQTTDLISIGNIAPGEHKLAFRLDSYTATSSQISIRNIQFKRFDGVTVVDIDNDGLTSEVDTDDDGDGIDDINDLFPSDPNEWADNDADGIGDNIDNDDDNDGYADGIDNCVFVANADQLDSNSDGVGDACDADGDGVPDHEDAFPDDPDEWADTDGDGTGNNADTDDDNDGVSDTIEAHYGSDPLDAADMPQPFADVPTSSPYYNTTLSLNYHGIAEGCGGGSFCPDQVIQRNTVAIWLIKAKLGGSYTPPVASGTFFADIADTTFAASYIEDLLIHGATEGCDASEPLNYCPDQPLTKAQAAFMLLRAKYGGSYDPGTATGLIFDDVASDDFASQYIEDLYNQGYSEGCSATPLLYCPEEVLTFGAFAELLFDTFGLAP